MALNKDYEDLLHLFNTEGVRYLIVGAYAVIYYTEPRYTKDIDIWIESSDDNAQKVYQALKKFGAPLKELTLGDLTNPDLVYQIGIEPNRIDILMGMENINFTDAWKRKTKTIFGNEAMYIIGIQDLIKAKKQAGRARDNVDLEVLNLYLKNKKKKSKK